MKISAILLVFSENNNKNEKYMHITLLATLLVSETNQCLKIRKKGIQEAPYHGSSMNDAYWPLVTQRSTSVYLLF